MHDDRRLVENRLRRVLEERVRPAVHGSPIPLDVERWDAPGEPVPVAEGLAAAYRPAAVGEPWGPAWGTTWFRLTGRVPREWAGQPVEALLDLGFDRVQAGFQCEGLVYLPDGRAVKGLHPKNDWVRVADSAAGGEDVLLHVEAAANPVLNAGAATGLGDRLTAGDAPLYRTARLDLAVFRPEVFELVHDFEVLGGLMTQLPEDDARRWTLLRALDRALDAIDLDDVPGSAPAARAELAGVLARPAHASAHRLSAVGHAHIDSAWLWPLRETVRKVARTSANVVALMDDHPDFVFAMSQAQQLAWLKEHRPEIFARVREKVADGTFVPVGGMWVESDTNMVGGEAMARQFVHGKRFFLDEFGIETREVWLPDSFGYTGALPQLVKLSGSQWFLTQKISWSQVNAFPHHTFWWEGIDGTRIFTHFPPIDTYNAELTGDELAHAQRNFREKGRATRSLVPFGFGDGGGGPTREMLARARRVRDLEGSPRLEIEPPEAFFRAAHEEYGAEAPVWVGELYLELHRGTYTSQAKTKQGNRHSESLLREAELWAATAAVRVPGYAYPYEDLDRIWKTVLLHQFHDILPGSSIAWVHREARETYARVRDELLALVDTAQRALAGEGTDTVVFNAAPHARGGVEGGGAAVREGTGDAPTVAAPREGGGFTLDNGLLRVTVDGRGLVVSAVDLAAGRDAIAPGTAGNLLQLHPDLPNLWDAWDVDEFYRHRVTDLVDVASLTLAAPDTVEVTRAFGSSRVVQRLTLRPGARALEIEADIDWREREKILKAAFPLDVKADVSAAETQFGHVERATHTNTTWEAAKFEICAHRWLRVGEPGWGAALVNDSTYGHDVTRDVRADGGQTTTVRLSLLRAPRYPDPETDQGTHRLRYALVPGATVADAVREGHWINLPERAVTGARAVAPLAGVESASGDIVLETVKLADDGSGDVVLRLYEASGGRAAGTLRAGLPLASVTATDLLERPLGGDADAPAYEAGPGGDVALALRPFEILTLRLSPAGDR
ncbi:alpha-mannosidase [Streptomyces avicenniae]|uniref:alpha-mannosidase n=1 Tax=Streptomyces avicenniae TaxID=500153 RepID=UPI00069C11AA|nr:glycoside hydrolase family 38 C-terminal domain-containing protein [Streptomyces avicenniae]